VNVATGVQEAMACVAAIISAHAVLAVAAGWTEEAAMLAAIYLMDAPWQQRELLAQHCTVGPLPYEAVLLLRTNRWSHTRFRTRRSRGFVFVESGSVLYSLLWSVSRPRRSYSCAHQLAQSMPFSFFTPLPTYHHLGWHRRIHTGVSWTTS